jgi:hypothetical protein
MILWRSGSHTPTRTNATALVVLALVISESEGAITFKQYIESQPITDDPRGDFIAKERLRKRE